MAKAFRFRLATVQRLREEARDRERRAAVEANARLSAATAVQARIANDLRDCVRQIREQKAVGLIDISGLRAGYLHQGTLMRKLEDAVVSVSKSRQEMVAQQKLLSEANARLKAMEKLRERQWRRHQAVVRREEQDAGDELALRMFVAPRLTLVECAEGISGDR